MGAGTNVAEVEMWDTVELTLATKKGDVKERGLVHPRAPGLAVTMMQFGTFDVTHIASGKTVAKGYQRLGNACSALAALACCADWTLDGGGIVAYIAEHGDEPANVPGWTSTSEGATRPQTKRQVVQGERGHFCGDEFPWESDEDDPMHHASKTLATLPAPSSVTP